MSNVVQFGNQESASGEAKCVDCGHEWTAIAPIPYESGLECPECGLSRGGYKYPMAPNEGEIVYQCNCGCSHFWVIEGGILCVGCGAVTTFNELSMANDI